MATRKGKATAPVSIRLSAEERSRLENAAGKRSLSEHIRAQLFGSAAPRRHVRTPKADIQLLARILGTLGQSEIASNLREVTQGIRAGTIAVSPETEKVLQTACISVIEIRADLMKALGLVERGPE
jgi:hypothetical protein